MVVLDVNVSLELVLCFKSYVAIGFANFVRADEVSLSEVGLQVLVFLVIVVLVLISTEMACQVVAGQMLKELQVAVEELLAEVAVRMW